MSAWWPEWQLTATAEDCIVLEQYPPTEAVYRDGLAERDGRAPGPVFVAKPPDVVSVQVD